MSEAGQYAVVAPVAPAADTGSRIGEPLPDLTGKRIGLLWDWYFKGDEMFAVLREELGHRYPGISFIGPDGFGSTHGDREEEVIGNLTSVLRAEKVDAVISAVGA
jgi:hypothetical protein